MSLLSRCGQFRMMYVLLVVATEMFAPLVMGVRCAIILSVMRSRPMGLGVLSRSVLFECLDLLSPESARTLPMSLATRRVLLQTCLVNLGMLLGSVTLLWTSLEVFETDESGAPSLRAMPEANLWCTRLVLCSLLIRLETCLMSGLTLMQAMVVLGLVGLTVRTGEMRWLVMRCEVV